MKRKIILLLCGLSAVVLSACSMKFKAEENTVYLKKDGTVLEANIEGFNESYYDEKELKEYVEESVSDYVQSNGDGSVVISDFDASGKDGEDRTVKLYLEYSSYLDYAHFNNVEFFDGTTADAKNTYDFERRFLQVQDGETGNAVEKEAVLTDSQNRVAVIGRSTVVRVDGTILFVSEGDVEVTGKNTAKVTYDSDASKPQLAYVIYTQ